MKTSIGGMWRGRPDPSRVGEKECWFADENSGAGAPGWRATQVPSCWNCDPKFERYEGTFWYATDFSVPEDRPARETELYIRFLAANYLCRVWLNGAPLGEHEGGFLPFEFKAPPDCFGRVNRLVAMVENFRSPRRIPGEVFDWFNYGGIARDVEIHTRSPRRFDAVRITTELSGGGGAVARVEYSRKFAFPFDWRLTDAAGDIVASGAAESASPVGGIDIIVENAKLWSPDDPHLYNLELMPREGSDADPFSSRVGVREIKADGAKILLNGKQIKLRGVSLHEEQVPFGRSMPPERRRRDVKDIKALGFNALRSAHYTHDEALLDAADEEGLLVFEEIPVYWDLDYASEKLRRTAAKMTRDMIERDFNHPCVILWSVGNEVPVENHHCDSLMRELMELARALDPTRLASYVSCRFMSDTTRRASDVCCVNCYVGWYYGDKKTLAPLMEMTRTTAPDKPWIVTEFGACAKFGFRNAANVKFSEEFQRDFLAHYIGVLNGMDWISGWFIWIYRDFKSPIRLNKYQMGFNRKGIVSEVNEKKISAEEMKMIMSAQKKTRPLSGAGWKAGLCVALEKAVFGIAMPFVSKSQRDQYNKYYRRDAEL
jgi:beta-glucuronidase